MSFFSKVFGEPTTAAEVHEPNYVETLIDDSDDLHVEEGQTDSPFAAFVKNIIVNGSQHEEIGDDDLSVEFYDEDEDEYDYSFYEEPVYEEEEADPTPAPTIAEVEEEERFAPPTLAETTAVAHTHPPEPLDLGEPHQGAGLFRASSTEQVNNVQVERIVDGLFDRMRVVWGDDHPRRPVAEAKEPSPKKQQKQPAPEPRREPEKQYPLAQSKMELTKLIQREVPQALKAEIVPLMRTEVMKAVRGEIVRVLREELDTFNRMIARSVDRLAQIEARIAKIEGSVDREIQVNFPKDGFKIEGPTINVPEREVKVAAPVNVQPPSVTFDEGAISVHFNKQGGTKKEVRFERDPHDPSCVKSAQIIDVTPGN